jgi:hypothetical protein
MARHLAQTFDPTHTMDLREFAAQLAYPDVWLQLDLLPGDLYAAQLLELLNEGGTTGAPEHYRYGAFHYWLRRDPQEERLAQLVEAASLDPDKAMAGAALKDIVSSSGSTARILDSAVKVAAKSSEYRVTLEILEEMYDKGR